jgi:superfamily II DNA or RNA helicase
LLRWLDVQTGSESERATEPPVIGLSATPWRGRDDDESQRLAARFDRRWMPHDQEALYERLRSRGVLAVLHYSPIRYNREINLTPEQVRYFDQYGELPDSLIEEIGNDPDRNERILECVLNSNASSILLFSNSVKHAQYLAARLHLAGCSAAAVSGETDRLARQHFIRRFKSGELKVLCNHSVLTTGFDAPKADMILISRPVFSPIRYMQMVGRGLRGPANGGTEGCLISTVEDNILNYRDRLAYHYCRRFFHSQ